MTNAEFEALGNYVRMVADRLLLSDWRFNIMHDVPRYENGASDPDAYAKIHLTYGRRIANVHFCHDFVNLEPARQRQTVVHELIHAHMENAAATVRELETTLGDMVWSTWHGCFVLNYEHGVDAIAEAFAPHMPLIEWPKPAAPKRKKVKR